MSKKSNLTAKQMLKVADRMPRANYNYKQVKPKKSVMNIIGNSLKVALFGFICWLFYYFGMPTTSFSFSSLFGVALFLGIIGGILFLPFVKMSNDDAEARHFTPTWAFGAIAVVSLLILIVGGCASTSTLREGWYEPKSNSFQAMLGKINDSCSITNDVSPIDPSHIVVMDAANALRLAEKRLTEYDKSLGSQTELGNPTLMKVNRPEGNFMMYVVPIEHSGLWKWYYNKTVPGYILVNAQNDKDVRMITEVNGKKLHMKYIPSGYFGDNLERHIYKSGYSNLGLTDYTLEVDDNLQPFYCVTIYENKIGWSGSNVTGVLVVDPVTGDIKKYGINDAPKWIDRIQPISFLEQQVKWWGEYVHGCWANWSGKDQLMPTEGSTLVYGNDDVCYIYIGVTSVGSDEASAGFFLINSRTKEARYYKMTGATEYAAKQSAAGAVGQSNPNLKTVTDPLPYNIDGEFTFVMAHKDDEGLVKAISFVSYTNYEIAGIGENMRLALADYKAKLREKNGLNTTRTKGLYDIECVVERINTLQENTYLTVIYFDDMKGLEKQGLNLTAINKIFVAPNSLSPELYLTKVGDNIKIQFENTTGKEIYLDRFDNLDIKTDTVTSTMAKYYQNFQDSLKTDKYAKDFDANYKNMSAEDKYKAKGVKTNTSTNPDDVKISKKAKANVENANKKK